MRNFLLKSFIAKYHAYHRAAGFLVLCFFSLSIAHAQGKLWGMTSGGGSDGIGKALVEMLLAQGAKVATCGRNYEKLYELQKIFAGQPLHIEALDISREDDCNHFINHVISTFGTIDILINNAGISMRALFKEVELQTLRNLIPVALYRAVQGLPFA